MLKENVVTNVKCVNHIFDPTHSFSRRGKNADLLPLSHCAAGCHDNLPVKILVVDISSYIRRIDSISTAIKYAIAGKSVCNPHKIRWK